MPNPLDLSATILPAWRTNNRITEFLFEHLPAELWAAAIPGAPRRTVRMIAGHIHNARCMWLKSLGKPHGIRVPASVNRHRVSRRTLLPALSRSEAAISRLLALGCAHGGQIPTTRAYAWRNLPFGRGACAELLRGSRGASPGPDRVGGSAAGSSTSGGRYEWIVAVVQAGRRSEEDAEANGRKPE